MTAASPVRCFALVPCAGAGSRSGAAMPKQYVPIAGRPMVAYTLDALNRVEAITATLVVLARDDVQFEAAVPAFAGERGWVARCGGATRAASVAAGLAALRERGAAADDWVLVHDAARCLIEPAWIERLIAACRDDEVGGLLALPLADTLKRVGPDGRVVATVDRTDKWLAQTPQMFRCAPLQQALERAGRHATDEAGAVEATGLAPRLVPGDARNVKVTYPDDFTLAERLLAGRAPLGEAGP